MPWDEKTKFGKNSEVACELAFQEQLGFEYQKTEKERDST